MTGPKEMQLSHIQVRICEIMPQCNIILSGHAHVFGNAWDEMCVQVKEGYENKVNY